MNIRSPPHTAAGSPEGNVGGGGWRKECRCTSAKSRKFLKFRGIRPDPEGPTPILEGNSLLPLFENPAASVNDVVFIEFGRYEVDHDLFGGFQPIRCATDGRHKLVINLLASDEFYDLENDPCEMDNLIESRDHASPRDRLNDRLLDWMNETRAPFRGYYWERRPWREDARPATWDYTGQTRQRPADTAFEKPVLDYDTGMPQTTQLSSGRTTEDSTTKQ